MSNTTIDTKIPQVSIHERPENEPKRKLSAVNIFVNRFMGAGFWMFFLLAAIIFWIIFNWFLEGILTREEKSAILTPDGTLIITAAKTYNDSKELHRISAEHAALSLFTRGPEGLIYDSMFQAYFLDAMQEKRLQDLEADYDFFREKNVFQNIDLDDEIILSEFENNIVMARVSGKIITNAKIGRVNEVNAESFKCDFTLIKNNNVGVNGYAPFAVLNYDIFDRQKLNAVKVDEKLLEGANE